MATKEIEEILDCRVGKSTRKKTYEEYLVKWKERLVEDSSWLAREEVNHLGFTNTFGIDLERLCVAITIAMCRHCDSNRRHYFLVTNYEVYPLPSQL